MGASDFTLATRPLLVCRRLSLTETLELDREAKWRMACDRYYQRLMTCCKAAFDEIERHPPDLSRANGRDLVDSLFATALWRHTVQHTAHKDADGWLWLREDQEQRMVRRAELVQHLLLFTGLNVPDPIAAFDELFWPLRFPSVSRLEVPERLIAEGAIRFYGMAWFCGPAEAEIERRLSRHVGGEAGRLLLYGKMKTRLAGWLDFDQEHERALDAVRLSVERKARPTMQQLLVEHRDRPPDVQWEVAGQIPITLDADWGHLDGLQALAAAIDGNLDIAPEAVAHDLVDALRRDSRRRKIEVHFVQNKAAGNPEAPTEEDVPSREPSPHEAAAFTRDLDRLSTVSPRLAEVARGRVRGETEQEIAARLGCDVRTVKRDLAEIRLLLRQ